MAIKLGHRPVKYVPFIAQTSDEPFSAQDVNRLLSEAEQAYESYMRRLEADNLEIRARCDSQIVELREITGICADRQAASQAVIESQSSRIATLGGETAELTAQLEGLRASISWRLTRPLRVLSRLLRRRGDDQM
ncbi:hypothetical protein [Sulfitobacter aestuariivivens]|uniref:Uncharacterized protein n=1 Tax=Sulfitobacter aestuariivivens TaxID=2766981 RepID=A0A927HH86_9RHOB|nr:hypothetical protein [Sulfitobacter aestuariivivens]MBD3666219.1 hypothetical protein [Sulfitobacter aestuariivivens]